MSAKRGQRGPTKKKIAKKAPAKKAGVVTSEKRKYEGAAKGKRLSRWQTSGRSANSELQGDLGTLRNRSRDLRRNNPYAAKAVAVIASNVVGRGITTQIRGESKLDVAQGPIEALWQKWSNSTDCDFEGRLNYAGLQTLVFESIVESGEVLVRYRFNAQKEIPLQLQVLESDFLDTNKTGFAENGARIIQGVEYDSLGRVLAYWLYDYHPGDASILSTKFSSTRVDAAEILHLFRKDRPGQGRGVPWAAPVMVRLKDLDDYEDAQLMRQKIAACFAAFVRDISADSSDGEDCSDLGEKIDPGAIEFLPPGKTVEFPNPPGTPDYKAYVATHLHAIATGFQITYEALTGDLELVNFSSARMGWLEFQRLIDKWRKNILYTQMLDPVVKKFLETLAIKGAPVDKVFWVHTPPKREMIDPTKEIPAIVTSIRAGLTTLSDEIASMGKDPGEVLAQIAQDNAKLDSLKLLLDSDPRRIGWNGQLQKEEEATDGPEENT